MRTSGWGNSGLLGNEINGKTLGIIGFGRIGQLTAKYAQCFNMNILVYDNYHLRDNAVADHQATAVNMTELMQQSDFVIMSVPRTEETINLVTKKELSSMKSTAYLIQASRGGVVNEDDLIQALQSGQLAGAAIDVFVGEPHIDPRFRTLPNVLLSPHVACSTYQSRYNSGKTAFAEIDRFFAGQPLLFRAKKSQLALAKTPVLS